MKEENKSCASFARLSAAGCRAGTPGGGRFERRLLLRAALSRPPHSSRGATGKRLRSWHSRLERRKDISASCASSSSSSCSRLPTLHCSCALPKRLNLLGQLFVYYCAYYLFHFFSVEQTARGFKGVNRAATIVVPTLPASLAAVILASPLATPSLSLYPSLGSQQTAEAANNRICRAGCSVLKSLPRWEGGVLALFCSLPPSS